MEKKLVEMAPAGLVETNAGVRSCMIEYDQRIMPLPSLLAAIKEADAAIGNVHVRPSPVLQPSDVIEHCTGLTCQEHTNNMANT